jgi:hypothetical protein
MNNNPNYIHSTKNKKYYYNLKTTIKIFIFFYSKHNLFIFYPTNHLNKYIKNYNDKIYKFKKYQLINNFNK